MTYASVPLDEAFDLMAAELSGFLTRICRRDSILVLERESAKHWTVVDTANDDEVMIRTPDLQVAVGWARTYVTRTPGASFDEVLLEEAWLAVVGHSVKVDGVVGEPSPTPVRGNDGVGAHGDGSPTARHLVPVPDDWEKP